MISVDSYGWIERFTDGPKAKQYNTVIDQEVSGDILVDSSFKVSVSRQNCGYRESLLSYRLRDRFGKWSAVSDTGGTPVPNNSEP